MENDTKKKMSVAELKSRKQKKHAIVKIMIQLFFFFMMPSAFVAGFNGVKSIFSRIGNSEPIEMNSFIIVLVFMMVFTILFGRFFCGYICAFGTTGDLLSILSEIVQKHVWKKKKKFSFPTKVIVILQKLKYFNLAAIVLFCVFGVWNQFTSNSIWDVFSMLIAGKLVQKTYLIGLVLLVLVLAVSCIQERFFCQFLCPMGALLALLPVIPIGRIRRAENNCIRGCDACRKKCPAAIKLEEDNLRTGECISCGKCRSSCPKGNIGFLEEKKAPEIVPVLIRAGVFFVMGSIIGICRLF